MKSIKSHNPYFNRWFSAIIVTIGTIKLVPNGHNPYFNRWFSAIYVYYRGDSTRYGVTILILIDGFLQYNITNIKEIDIMGHNPYFNRWFSAIICMLSRKISSGCVTILILIDGFLQ